MYTWYAAALDHDICTSLLSLLPPSCMVAPIRELANTLHPTTLKSQNTNQELSNQLSMNFEFDILRGRAPSPNPNMSRDLLVSSAASSMDYAERMECMEAQGTNKSWAEQVKSGNSQEFSLSYVSLEPAPAEPAGEHVPTPQGNGTMNMQIPLVLESSAIPYQTNQPADPHLWDGSFAPISLFGINEYLTGDAKNIMCSLYRMATFIKKCPLATNQLRTSPKFQTLALQRGSS